MEKLVLIDPAGARTLFVSRLARVLAAPAIGETFLNLAGSGGLLRTIATGIFNKRLVDEFAERYRVQVQYKGFRNAILSIRNGVIDSCIDTYRQVGVLNKRVGEGREGRDRAPPGGGGLAGQFRTRLPTPKLNELLEAIQEAHPAPLSHGHVVKLYYVSMVSTAPPTLVLQASRPETIPDHYKRFVENRFREAFGLRVPLRFVYRERSRRDRPRRSKSGRRGA